MRRKDGNAYQELGCLGFRAAIQRELNRLERGINIYSDDEFRKTNEVLDGFLKKLRREGKMEPEKHKTAISPADMDKIRYLFDHDKGAENLTRQIWFGLTMHFGLRGREVQAKMLKTDIKICAGEEGEYIRLRTDFATKNYQGGSGSSRRDIGEGLTTDKGDILPFKILLRTLHPDCPRLFQRVPPKYSPRDAVWFCNMPLGKTTLAHMMQDMSAAAGLSTIYTNHCLRATVLSMLSAEDVEDRHIMSVTWHKNALSLRSNTKPTTSQQRSMSAILDGHRATKSSVSTPEATMPKIHGRGDGPHLRGSADCTYIT